MVSGIPAVRRVAERAMLRGDEYFAPPENGLKNGIEFITQRFIGGK